MHTRKIANNLRLLSIVSILLYVLFPPFSALPFSVGSPTGVLHGNVSEYALIPGKYTDILFGCIGNRLCILVILESVYTLILGTVHPPSYALYPEYLRIYGLPRLDPLWIRLDDGPVNGAKSGLELSLIHI